MGFGRNGLHAAHSDKARLLSQCFYVRVNNADLLGVELCRGVFAGCYLYIVQYVVENYLLLKLSAETYSEPLIVLYVHRSAVLIYRVCKLTCNFAVGWMNRC